MIEDQLRPLPAGPRSNGAPVAALGRLFIRVAAAGMCRGYSFDFVVVGVALLVENKVGVRIGPLESIGRHVGIQEAVEIHHFVGRFRPGHERFLRVEIVALVADRGPAVKPRPAVGAPTHIRRRAVPGVGADVDALRDVVELEVRDLSVGVPAPGSRPARAAV